MSLTPRIDALEKNYIINGNFDFWQRNTTFATPSSGSYTSDRYVIGYNGSIGTFSISRQAFVNGQNDVPGNPSYFFRWDQTVAGSGSTARAVAQRIESVRTLANKIATVVFWAKADSARTVGVFMAQQFGTGGSPSSEVVLSTQNVNLTTVWQRFKLTFSIPSILGKTIGTDNNDSLRLEWSLPLNTTMTIDLSSVMVLEGDKDPTEFIPAGRSVGDEFRLCQRYYQRGFQGAFTVMFTTANANLHIPLRVPMRVTPTASNIAGVSLTNIINRIGAGDSTATSIPGAISPIQGGTQFGSISPTGSLGQPITLNADLLQFDAEL